MPRANDETFKAEIGRDLASEFLSDRRAVARADNGHRRKAGELEIAFDEEERRRRIDMRQCRRVARLADRDELGADAVGSV